MFRAINQLVGPYGKGETPIVHSLRSFTHGFSPYNPSSLGRPSLRWPRAADAALESCTQQSCENTCNGGGANSLINKQVHIVIEQCIKQWLQFFECVYRVNTIQPFVRMMLRIDIGIHIQIFSVCISHGVVYVGEYLFVVSTIDFFSKCFNAPIYGSFPRRRVICTHSAYNSL